MRFTATRDDKTRKTTYVLEVDESERVAAQFDKWDQHIIESCSQEGGAISHKLIALEVIVRRIEEAQKRDEITPKKTSDGRL
jgi:hypothetical protein